MGMESVVRGVTTTKGVSADTVEAVAARKISEIDGNTARLQAAGFPFLATMFSMEATPWQNAISVFALRETWDFPQPWTDTENKIYMFDRETFEKFFQAMIKAGADVKNAATGLRFAVARIVSGDLPEAEKIQAILAIKDTRL